MSDEGTAIATFGIEAEGYIPLVQKLGAIIKDLQTLQTEIKKLGEDTVAVANRHQTLASAIHHGVVLNKTVNVSGVTVGVPAHVVEEFTKEAIERSLETIFDNLEAYRNVGAIIDTFTCDVHDKLITPLINDSGQIKR